MKNLAIGFLTGILLMAFLGAYSQSDKADFGFAIPKDGVAVLKDEQGRLLYFDTAEKKADYIDKKVNLSGLNVLKVVE
jgi:hypothetical protein